MLPVVIKYVPITMNIPILVVAITLNENIVDHIQRDDLSKTIMDYGVCADLLGGSNWINGPDVT